MSFTQLTQPLPVFVVGKGKGTAIAVIDYGPEANLIWVTALDDSGELWCAPNPAVRMRANWTLGRASSPVEVEACRSTGEESSGRGRRALHISDPDGEHAPLAA